MLRCQEWWQWKHPALASMLMRSRWKQSVNGLKEVEQTFAEISMDNFR